jgi:hypothetical protein
MGDTNSFGLSDLSNLMSALSRMAGGQTAPPRVEPPMNAPGRAAGLKAVEGATTGRQEPTVSGETARAAGLSAVDKEMDAANTEAWKAKMAGRKADRARAGSEGAAAVADATSPSRVRDIIAQLAQQPGWSPEESAHWAQAMGQVGVENALHQPNNPPGWSPPQPMLPPGQTFGPMEVAAPDMAGQTPYAPASQRASHYGKDAVSRELDKEPE